MKNTLDSTRLKTISIIAEKANKIGASFADMAFDYLVDTAGMSQEDAEELAYELESDYEDGT